MRVSHDFVCGATPTPAPPLKGEGCLTADSVRGVAMRAYVEVAA
jgi:hypothetical protein